MIFELLWFAIRKCYVCFCNVVIIFRFLGDCPFQSERVEDVSFQELTPGPVGEILDYLIRRGVTPVIVYPLASELSDLL